MARIAKSLDKLRSQVNAKYPKRRKASDGWIGDARHRAVASDHNPNSKGVVTALDLTHHAGYFDAHKLADRLIKYRHPNLEYVISNRRIAGAWTGWKWRAYSGSNPHTKHIHVSVGSGGGGADGKSTHNYDSTKAWNITSKGEDMYKGRTAKWLYDSRLVWKKRASDYKKKYLTYRGYTKTWRLRKEAADKELAKLRTEVDKLSQRPTKAELDNVNKQLEKVESALADKNDTNEKVTTIFDYFSARWATFREFLKRK